MKVYYVSSLESPHRCDSNEYTQNTIFNMKKKKHSKLSQISNYWIFSKGLKNEFETAVVNEPSVFEPLKFYCISMFSAVLQIKTHVVIPCFLWFQRIYFDFLQHVSHITTCKFLGLERKHIAYLVVLLFFFGLNVFISIFFTRRTSPFQQY